MLRDKIKGLHIRSVVGTSLPRTIIHEGGLKMYNQISLENITELAKILPELNTINK